MNIQAIIEIPYQTCVKYIHDLHDISQITLHKIKHFFEYYKKNDIHKWCKVDDFKTKEYAINLIHQKTIS